MKPDHGQSVSSDNGGLMTAHDFSEVPQTQDQPRTGLKNKLMLRISAVILTGVCLLFFLTGGSDPVARAEDAPKGTVGTSKSKKAEVKKAGAAATPMDAEKKDEAKAEDDAEAKRPPKVVKTNAEWKKVLQPLSFRVARLKETEQPFSNKYWNNKKDGKYLCVCCGEELYRSDEKFDSGTGWPSFWAPASERAIATETDYANNNVRTEVHCDRCGAHLGHIFDDGPQPTGMRHCINSASLKFVPADASKTK